MTKETSMYSLERASAWMVCRIAWSLAIIALGGRTMCVFVAKQMETDSRSAAKSSELAA